MKINNAGKLTITLLASLAAGAIGSLFTFQSIPTWYATLHKTVITPPNWVFGPVWTTLYILMAVAAFLVWRENKKDLTKEGLILFGEQLVLNAAWSIVFFGEHEVLFAFVVIVVLWLSILATIFWFFRVSKTAGWLMIPYILWVSFASMLNFAVYLANK